MRYDYEKQSTYSSANFTKYAIKWFKRHGITIECAQTDNGFEFTNRFSPSKKDKKTLFENTLAQLGIQHKLIRPYTPQYNGKVERKSVKVAALPKILCKSKTNQTKVGLQSKRSLGFPLDCSNFVT